MTIYDRGRSSPRELQEVIAAERLGLPFLLYRDDTGAQLLFSLGGREPSVTIGRSEHADVRLTYDEEVSRYHAELRLIGRDWAIIDDGISTNGTFVNGQRTRGRRLLTDRDVVRLGKTTLIFRQPAPTVVARTTPAIGIVTVDQLTPTQRSILIALCRPFKDTDRFVTPATNPDIANELHLSVDNVKAHLRTLYQRFKLDELSQNQKRARLAELAIDWGLVTHREL